MQNRYDDEVEYWKGALSNAFSSGADSNSKYRKLLDVELELDPTIAKELPQPAPEGGWRVLDVGCGPLTVLGKKFQNSRLNITGVDPLADQYMQMLTELGVVPPFEARQGFGEEVNRYFPHNHFDLVYSRNALDHSQHPHLAIRSMIQVAKPGTAIWVNVNRNEAVNAAYNGLHSWNFDVLYNTIAVWTPGQSILFDQICDGLPFKWTVTELGINKTCPQELDIVIYKDAVDVSSMNEAAPGIFSSITGRGEFVTIWAPADLDERYNLFVHGYTPSGVMALNTSFRWYNTLRRRSVRIPLELGISRVQFGQFDVSFQDGKPVYKNLWVGNQKY